MDSLRAIDLRRRRGSAKILPYTQNDTESADILRAIPPRGTCFCSKNSVSLRASPSSRKKHRSENARSPARARADAPSLPFEFSPSAARIHQGAPNWTQYGAGRCAEDKHEALLGRADIQITDFIDKGAGRSGSFSNGATLCSTTSSLVALSPMVPSTRISQRRGGHRSFVRETLESVATVACAPWGRYEEVTVFSPPSILFLTTDDTYRRGNSIPMLSCRTPSLVTRSSTFLSRCSSRTCGLRLSSPLTTRYHSAQRVQRLVEKTRNDTGSSDDGPLADWVAVRGEGALDGGKATGTRAKYRFLCCIDTHEPIALPLPKLNVFVRVIR
ncbi:hypothetical protein B0H14DRAFT_3895080, partial [Mycena olivaceomarginata]